MILVVIATVIYVTSAQAVPPVVMDAFAKIMRPLFSECVCATGVAEAVALQWMLKLEHPNDPCLKCFIKCSLLGVDFINPDGTVNYQIPNNPIFNGNLVKICDNQTLGQLDICQKVFDMSVCISNQFSTFG